MLTTVDADAMLWACLDKAAEYDCKALGGRLAIL